MFSQFSDKYFWYLQPSSILSNIDWAFGYFFAGLTGLAIILWIVGRFVKNDVFSKLLKRLVNLLLTTGLSGIAWFGLRFENTPIFARHYWAAVTILIGIIWLLFILKYLIFNLGTDLKSYDRELVKKKYLP